MTNEERAYQLATLEEEAKEHCKFYNAAYQEARFSDAAAEAAIVTEKVNEYTRVARDGVFEICKNSENPMLEAVKRLTFATIAAKDTQTDGDKVPVRSIVPTEKPIDLIRLHKYCGSIGANKEWAYHVQKFNMLLTMQKCVDLGIDPRKVNDSYYMHEYAKQVDLGKTPTSKTNILKTLQSIVTAMLGDGYKATSHDVNYLLSIYSKKNRKALSVTCANHSYLTRYLAEICHRIITGESYDVVYKAKKEG